MASSVNFLDVKSENRYVPESVVGSQTYLMSAMDNECLELVVDPVAPGMHRTESSDIVNLTLHQAARDGDTVIMEKLLASIRNLTKKINSHDEDSMSPLHYAARYNHVAIASMLVAKGADVNDKGEDELTPLHLAARRYKLVKTQTAVDSSVYFGGKGKVLAINALCANLNSAESTQSVNQQNQDVQPPVETALDQSIDVPQADAHTNSDDEDDDEKESVIKYLVSKGAQVNAPDIYGSTPLHFAAMRGNISAAKDLLSCNGIKIEAVDKQECSALHIACLHGYLEIVNLLIAAGANLRCMDEEKMSPLHCAAKEGHENIVSVLLDAGHASEGWAIVSQMVTDQDNEGNTALHLAVDGGHFGICQILLNNGANVNTYRNHYNTPLHLAAVSGDIRIIELLLEHKARIDVVNDQQATALHRAAAYNHYKVVEFLLEKGAKLERRDKDNFTPLVIASSFGHTETIRCLLQHGADIRAVDKNDQSCMYWAAEDNHIDALKELLTHYKARRRINAGDRYGNSPLHIAAERGFHLCVRLLLEYGAIIDDKNELEQTALHLASRHGRTATVTELLNHSKMIVNDEDEESNTPLHLAALFGQINIANILLTNGANVEARNCNLWTPLDCAAYKGNVNVVKILLEADSPVDPTDKGRTTPLHLACTKGHVKVAEVLISWGANVAFRDSEGNNCLDRAIDNGHQNVAVVIVNSRGWRDALKNDTVDPVNGRRLTPVRKLIKKMPDVVEQVYARCTVTNGLHHEHTDFEVTFYYEFLDDMYSHWNEQTMPSTDAASFVTHVSTFDDDGRIHADAQPYSEDSSALKKNHPLMIMAKSNREHLLKHPLVTALLVRKWKTFGAPIYYINLMIFMVYLTFLTGYMLTTKPPFVYHVNGTVDLCAENIEDEGLTQDMFARIGKFVIMALAGFQLLRELFQIYYSKWHYLDWENLLEWVSYVFSLLLVIDFAECQQQTGIREDWQWQLGAIAIFLAWCDLILFLRKFPQFGIYVVMFTWILWTFCQFFIVFFLFIVAFAMSFYALMQNQVQFRDPWNALLKTTVMMIGEFEFDDIFNDGLDGDPGEVVNYGVTYAVFVIFLIIMTILIMNLLVGLAVDDIKEVQSNAALRRLAMQVELTLGVEGILPHWLRKRFVIQSEKVRPNIYKKHFWTRYMYRSGIDIIRGINAQQETEQDALKRLKDQNEDMRRQLDDVHQRVQRLNSQNARILSVLHSLASQQGVVLHEEDQNEMFE